MANVPLKERTDGLVYQIQSAVASYDSDFDLVLSGPKRRSLEGLETHSVSLAQANCWHSQANFLLPKLVLEKRFRKLSRPEFFVRFLKRTVSTRSKKQIGMRASFHSKFLTRIRLKKSTGLAAISTNGNLVAGPWQCDRVVRLKGVPPMLLWFSPRP